MSKDDKVTFIGCDNKGYPLAVEVPEGERTEQQKKYQEHFENKYTNGRYVIVYSIEDMKKAGL